MDEEKRKLLDYPTTPVQIIKPNYKIQFYVLLIIALIVTICCIIISLFLVLFIGFNKCPQNSCALKPSQISTEDVYQNSAVATDAVPCQSIVNTIMNIEGGNAVDGAIAGVICSCSVNIHSCGIGGGSFINVYIKKNQMSYTLDLREEAPGNATKDMYVKNPILSTEGGLSIGVPGLVGGLYELHQKLGKLSWKKLVEPTVVLLENGVAVPEALSVAIKLFFQRAKGRFNALADVLTNKKTGQPLKQGELLFQPKIIKTLRILMDEPFALRNGSLAKIVAQEIQTQGGIVTEEDLGGYKIKWREPVIVKTNSGVKIRTLPPPSGGVLVGFIHNVLSNYDWSSFKIDDCNKAALFYHRFTETLKFAYGSRSAFGDEDFWNITQLMNNLTSSAYSKYIQSQITDDRTHPIKYYHPQFELAPDYGTSHLSLVSRDGDAVSVTSTINTYFGSMVMGNMTGIIYNNEMDDFSTPNKSNSYNLPPSPSNFIVPGKRPQSSMSPIIITNSTGHVVMVIGASGGSRIPSSVSQVISLVEYMNLTIKEAIDYPRLHHQLVPDYISLETNFPKNIQVQLLNRGHILKNSTSLAVVQGIHLNTVEVFDVTNDAADDHGSISNVTKIQVWKCNADFRKRGLCGGT